MISSPNRLRLESLEAREVPAILGTLDPSFGTDGKLSIAGVTQMAMFADADGVGDSADRIVTTLASDWNQELPTVVTRLLPDGTADPAFGTNGTFTFPADTLVKAGTAAVDAADNVYVTGRWKGTGELAVGKLLPTGVLDTTYGTDGILTIANPTGYAPGTIHQLKVLVDATGSVIVVESMRPTLESTERQAVTRVVRVTPAGVLDPAFAGGSPLILTDFISNTATSTATLDPSGRLVLLGADGFLSPVLVARLTTTGEYDTTFGGTGKVKLADTSLTAGGLVSASVATGSGGEVVVGLAGAEHAVVVMKFTADGVADASFGVNGVWSQKIGSMIGPYDTIHGLAVADDGSVLGGTTTSLISYPDVLEADFAVFKLTPEGQLDTRFNPGGPMPGVNVFDFNGNSHDRVKWIALDSDGDIYVGGGSNGNTGEFNMVIAKLHGTGDDLPVVDPPAAPVAPRNPFPESGGPVRMVRGNVDGDDIPDSIFVTGPGVPLRVAVVGGKDGTVIVSAFDPFGDDFTGGGFVAAGDFDGDGRDEIVVTPDDGGGTRAVIYSIFNAAGSTPVSVANTLDGSVPQPVSSPTVVPPDWRPHLRVSFFGIEDRNFRGGARVAVGDVNGDGVPDLTVTAGNGGGPRVSLLDGKTLLTNPERLVNDFFALPGDLPNGVYVTTDDVDGDGKADLVFGAGAGGAPRVVALSGQLLLDAGADAATTEPIANFYAGNPDDRDGVQVVNSDDGVGLSVPPPPVVYCFVELPADTPTGFESASPADAAALGVFVG